MKQIIKTFNKLIKKTIFNVQNKTNINFKINHLNIVKRFNKSVEKTIFSVQSKTSQRLAISKFNKYVITFVSVLFIYLFYLLIPVLYDKNWVQKNIESKLFKNFNIHFSLSSDISYRILPSPHFLIKDAKILINETEKPTVIAKIKYLKVFVNQGNFFDKKKLKIKETIINNANFSLLRSDLKLLNKFSNNQFSNKKIKINDSVIFFKDNSDEIISIIKTNNAILYFNDEKLLNLFSLKGEVFSIPFTFNFKSKKDSLKVKETNLKAKLLKLDIFNESIKEKNNFISGKNIIKFLNSKINTKYNVKDELITFVSENSRINNSKIKYSGELSINPFDLDLKINLDNYKISKIFNVNSILTEFIKSELLFNNNISIKTSIVANSDARNEIFQNAKIEFHIIHGKMNFNNTKFTNNDIGSLQLNNSNLFSENKKLILNTDILFVIKDSNSLFSFLNTNKKSRREIKNILVNLDYDVLNNLTQFNKVKIDNNEVSDEFLRIIEGFNDNEFNNLTKSRRLLNELLNIYEG